MVHEVPIADVVRPCSTWSPKRSGSGKFDYIDLSSVDKHEKSITFIERHECSAAPSRAKQLVAEGDVLVATVRPNLNGVAIVQAEHDGMTASTGFCVLRPNPDRVISRYLLHWVKTPEFVKRMVDVATGANYPAVSDTKVKNSSMPLPPLPEQKRIAEILDAADALRAKRRESLAQLDAFLQSTFLHMFGDPTENPNGWKCMALPSVSVRFSDGPFGSNLKSSHYVHEGVRVIRLQNVGVGELFNYDLAFITPSHYASMPRNHCKPGDVIIGTLGDPNLRACVVPDWLCDSLNKADCIMMRVNPDLANNKYICWLLNCPSTVAAARSLIRGQTRGRISRP